jgi:sulfide:quinone oxidoreductase
MPDIRTVTADFSVAPQISEADIAAIAAIGFKTLINNRPDDEVPGQMTDAAAQAAAQAAGLAYVSIPFAGAPHPAHVEETVTALESNPGPVLAFCRSGTRSVTVWALAQAVAGALPPEDIIKAAAEAGYDLSPYKLALTRLAGD